MISLSNTKPCQFSSVRSLSTRLNSRSAICELCVYCIVITLSIGPTCML